MRGRRRTRAAVLLEERGFKRCDHCDGVMPLVLSRHRFRRCPGYSQTWARDTQRRSVASQLRPPRTDDEKPHHNAQPAKRKACSGLARRDTSPSPRGLTTGISSSPFESLVACPCQFALRDEELSTTPTSRARPARRPLMKVMRPRHRFHHVRLGVCTRPDRRQTGP
jgi:hypothetical protein